LNKKAKSVAAKAATSLAERDWCYDQIDLLKTETVKIDRDTHLVSYHSDIRSDESHTSSAEPEELVHALIVGLLCSPQYRYTRSAVWHEKHYAHGSKGSKADEVDILLVDSE
jgi:hypothetical protein